MLISNIAYFIIGVAVILVSSHFFVKVACKIGEILHWSDVLIGVVILGIGTSMPEISISIYTQLTHQENVLLGNIIGSNIANSVLVIGVAYLFAHQQKLTFVHFKKTYWIMLILSVMLLLGVYWQKINIVYGGIMIALGIFSFMHKAAAPSKKSTHQIAWLKLLINIVYISVLFGLIFLSTRLIVNSGLAIAEQLQFKVSSFAALFIAVSTSLPEIAVCAIAASQRKLSLVFSGILGSNIANIGFAIGLSTLPGPILVHANNLLGLTVIMLIVSALLVAWLLTSQYLNKIKGFLLLGAYAWLAYGLVHH